MPLNTNRVVDDLAQRLAARRQLAIAQRIAYRRLIRSVVTTAPVQQRQLVRAA